MNTSSDRTPGRPWAGIAASVTPVGDVVNDYADARRSPCESCATAPCCSYLPLGSFRTTTVSDLDYAAYLLNFKRIELGLTAAGDWSVFYRHPCRYLDRSTFACTVHEQPEQPHICRRYDPYRCWYKTALTRRISPDYIRLDRTRLDYMVGAVGFDATGNIVESPAWPDLLQALEPLHDTVEEVEEPAPPPTVAASTRRALPVYSYDQVQHPCTGCAAYCCRTLMFPMERPADISGLDYVQFSLGFPGIRVAISDAQWIILVETECRHLRQERCSIFGQPERPLICRYYDEWRCSYRQQYEQAEAMGFLHADLERYRCLLRHIDFEENGTVRQMPTVAALREMSCCGSVRSESASAGLAVTTP